MSIGPASIIAMNRGEEEEGEDEREEDESHCGLVYAGVEVEFGGG